MAKSAQEVDGEGKAEYMYTMEGGGGGREGEGEYYEDEWEEGQKKKE